MLSTSSCSALPTLIRSAVQAADIAQQVYFARHPNPETQETISRLKEVYYRAQLAYDGDPSPDNRDKLVSAYRALYAELGPVMTATPPPGGAESDSRQPEPIDLPTPEEVERGLR
jgi:hypothetical protein